MLHVLPDSCLQHIHVRAQHAPLVCGHHLGNAGGHWGLVDTAVQLVPRQKLGVLGEEVSVYRLWAVRAHSKVHSHLAMCILSGVYRKQWLVVDPYF